NQSTALIFSPTITATTSGFVHSSVPSSHDPST
ncbi:unnamed protein product, partial [Rotaria sp. Silwood1]